MNIERKPLFRAIRVALLQGALWASVGVLALGGSAFAQDDFSLGEEETPAVDFAALRAEQTTVKSEIEIGFGDVSESSYRFGRYNGLDDDGLFPIVNIDIYKRPAWDSGDDFWWRLSGRNLGLDSRDLSFAAGRQGHYEIRLGFDEIPHNQFDDGFTIFDGAGSGNLTLPAGWVAGQNTATMTNLIANLKPTKVEHSRQRFDVGGHAYFGSGWKTSVDYSREKKDGTKSFGLVMGNSGGNSRAVVAPVPIDFVTEQVDAKLSWADATKQISFGYYVSLFENDSDSITWQNPYSLISGWANASVGFPNGQGRMALEPDNQFHQLTVNGGWSFTPQYRLSGDVAIGRGTQDDDFQPYTVNPTLAASITAPLPVDSLDGEVDTTYVGLRFSGQPGGGFGFNLNYKFDERDNKTHHHVFDYIGGDSQLQTVSATSGKRRINEPKSYKEQSFKADARWNATDWLRISGEAQYRDIERPHQEREEIEESRYALNFELGGGEYLSGGLRMAQSDRDGGSEYLGYITFIGGYSPGYTATILPLVGGFPFENHPDLRKYNQADRERSEGELYVNLMAGDAVAIGASVNYAEDDYDNSILGLTFSRVSSYNVDFTWTPTERFTMYAFASEERYKNDQDGRSFVSGATRPVSAFDPNRVWNTKSRDYVLTYGIGGNVKFAEDKLTLGLDLVDSEVESNVRTVTGPSLARADLPESGSELLSASLYADYKWRKDWTFRWRVAYEGYKSYDWALDNFPPNQMANVITMGEQSPEYDVWVSTFSVAYRF